jgi:hypothetical protein
VAPALAGADRPRAPGSGRPTAREPYNDSPPLARPASFAGLSSLPRTPPPAARAAVALVLPDNCPVFTLHSLHWYWRRPCVQMALPPRSRHMLLMRPCSQICAPPQSLHWLRGRRCSHMLEPPQSTQLLFCRLCGQMLEQPHRSHWLRWRRCSQKLDPRHALHRRLCAHAGAHAGAALAAQVLAPGVLTKPRASTFFIPPLSRLCSHLGLGLARGLLGVACSCTAPCRLLLVFRFLHLLCGRF